MGKAKEVEIITSAAGGTMTDILVVDKHGDFVIGKASTTPHDESIGFWDSLGDAFEYWGVTGRLSPFGEEIMPLYEHDTKIVVEDLLEMGQVYEIKDLKNYFLTKLMYH
jgi:hypothetical protein